MDCAYSPLPLHAPPQGARFMTPDERCERVQMDSPALAVMTDFALVPAASIDTEAPIDAAHRFMIRRGVRLLLVTDEERRVLGLISATDLAGEKPVSLALSTGIARHELKVRDVMTPRERLDALAYEVVMHAQVGHIVATLRQSGRQHTLVSQRSGGDPGAVRGVFSLSQIARQLGIAIATTEVAQTFAEIEAALAR
jgi:signal-transduction protein with cAMP-binding, CBS, and nucleotidyltransferase domain